MKMMPAAVITLSFKSVEKVVPRAYEIFFDTLESCGVSFEDLSAAVYYGDDFDNLDLEEEEENNIDMAYKYLVDSFQERTGFPLHVMHHESINKHDEVEGGNFAVLFQDVFDKTEKAKAFEEVYGENLELSYFVIDG